MPHTILIADADPMSRNQVCYVIRERLGYATRTVTAFSEVVDMLSSSKHSLPAILVMDMSRQHSEAIETIRTLRALYAQMPILVLIQEGETKRAMEAVKAGANDFITRPLLPERLIIAILNAMRLQSLGEEVSRLRRNHHAQVMFTDIIGQSALLRAAVSLGQKAAASSTPVLLEGEAGTGRKMLAHAIHAASDRTGRPFIIADCALAEKQLESVLFGSGRIAGKFHEASNGTLYLENIDKLSLSLQAKLLHLFQQGKMEVVGATSEVAVDVRVIAATHSDLGQQVKQGCFRADLFYPLEALTIRMPSLRSRREDILLLGEYYLRRFAAIEGKTVRGYSHDLAEALLKYDWPGNVRQLEQMIQRAVMVCDGTLLERRHFPPAISGVRPRVSVPDSSRLNGNGALALLDMVGNVRRMVELEAEIIQFALRHYGNHMSEVARRLGIGRSTLYRKINDYNIKEETSVLPPLSAEHKIASA